jgi:hypothetical protein
MKPLLITLKVIGCIAWILILLMCICNPLMIVWKLVFAFIWLILTWLGWELKRAPTVPDDDYYDKYKF